jgi:hypothetical protein
LKVIMASKTKSKAAKRDGNKLTASAKPAEHRAVLAAQLALRPSTQAAFTITGYSGKLGDLDLGTLVEELKAQIEGVKDGDLSQVEAVLTVQAHTLDAIFNSLAQRASANMGAYLSAMETLLRLALKAQSQCRATLETLAAVKNPQPLAFVRQQNVVVNQQVNNGASPVEGVSRARETDSAPSKLLEVKDGKRLDTGAACTPGRANKAMAPVGTLDGAEDSGR